VALREGDVFLKVELINDVPAHVGDPASSCPGSPRQSGEHPGNKVSALVDRGEPKDLADIWGFCCRMGLPLEDAIIGAQSKAAGVFPADLARLLCSVTSSDWELIRWIAAPEMERFKAELNRLGESLLLGSPAC
jgi:hypothetical protein